jgi:hypothetical protein
VIGGDGLVLAVIASRRPELYGDLIEEKAKKKALKEIAGKKKRKRRNGARS